MTPGESCDLLDLHKPYYSVKHIIQYQFLLKTVVLIFFPPCYLMLGMQHIPAKKKKKIINKSRVIFFKCGFHGDTHGSTSDNSVQTEFVCAVHLSCCMLFSMHMLGSGLGHSISLLGMFEHPNLVHGLFTIHKQGIGFLALLKFANSLDL